MSRVIKKYRELTRTLGNKKVPYSLKFKESYVEEVDQDKLLVVIGCYNRFLTFYIYGTHPIVVATMCQGIHVRLVVTAHFKERFIQRYNSSDMWRVFLVKELSTILTSDTGNKVKVRTRHGYAIVAVRYTGNVKVIYCITYVSRFRTFKKKNPPMTVFTKLPIQTKGV